MQGRHKETCTWDCWQAAGHCCSYCYWNGRGLLQLLHALFHCCSVQMRYLEGLCAGQAHWLLSIQPVKANIRITLPRKEHQHQWYPHINLSVLYTRGIKLFSLEGPTISNPCMCLFSTLHVKPWKWQETKFYFKDIWQHCESDRVLPP